MAITEARTIKNALKAAKFRYEETGFPAFLVIKAKPPKRAFEVITLDGAGQDIPAQQAGGHKEMEYELTAIFTAVGQERAHWEKRLKEVLTGDTSIYYRDATLTAMGPNNAPSMIWQIQDSWPEEGDFEEFESSDKKKLVQIKLKMRCNDYEFETV